VLAWLYVLDAYEGGLPSARYLGWSRTRPKRGAPADYVGDCAPARVARIGQVSRHPRP